MMISNNKLAALSAYTQEVVFKNIYRYNFTCIAEYTRTENQTFSFCLDSFTKKIDMIHILRERKRVYHRIYAGDYAALFVL